MKAIDLTGMRFGRLKVLLKTDNLFDPRKSCGRTAWFCVCDCGNQKIIATSSLRNGDTQSCGCFRTDRIRESTFVDLTGKKFTRLTVIKQVSSKKYYGTMWLCICECGAQITCNAGGLNFGRIRSCGCLRRKLDPQMAQINRAYRSFKSSAKTRHLSIEISKDQWFDLVTQPCYFCHEKSSNIWTVVYGCYGETFRCNGIDRLNPQQAYTKENCVSCCKNCNDAKGTLSKDNFIDLITRIYKHQKVLNASA